MFLDVIVSCISWNAWIRLPYLSPTLFELIIRAKAVNFLVLSDISFKARWSQADYRLQGHMQVPGPPQIAQDEDASMEDVGQDDPLQYSTATRAALDHLPSQIDLTDSTLSTNLTSTWHTSKL